MSLLAGITDALRTPDQEERARLLSGALSGLMPHRALAMLVDTCSRSPVGFAGEDGVADHITVDDFARLEDVVASQAWQGQARVAGQVRPVVAVGGPGDAPAVLLLVRDDATPVSDELLAMLAEAWALFAVATGHAHDDATADDLNASRAAAGERARVVAELADAYRVALSGILGALRARHLDDQAARRTATDLAASAMVELNTSVQRERELGDKPLVESFARLRKELAPVTRFSTARLEFVAPPDDRLVRLSPAVALAARAISRGAVLALLDRPGVGRLRVAWTLADGLEISVRDDGPGAAEPSVDDGSLADRARALGGSVEVERVPGWGTHVLARLPLEDATGVDPTVSDPLAMLRPRELEVLAELASGRRNREIAKQLSISENTVKFHVANVFDKLGVGSRNHAALVARAAGIRVEPMLHVALGDPAAPATGGIPSRAGRAPQSKRVSQR